MNSVQRRAVEEIEGTLKKTGPAVAWEVNGRISSAVTPGSIRIICEFPPAAGQFTTPVIDEIDLKALWNAGERHEDVTRELYASAFVEPFITWASDLSWRVTAAGKKAGLK